MFNFGNTSELLVRLVAGAPIFLLAIILHEVAHGYVAYRCGDPTAKLAGRLTLDPWKHIDPLGVLVYVVTLFGSGGRFAFGWAKPVPVNVYLLQRVRLDFMLVAIAGPITNILQMLAWTGITRGLVLLLPPTTLASLLVGLAVFGVVINAVLVIFNLIPVPPLDGSRVLAWLLPDRGVRILDQLEPFGMFIVFGLLFLRVFDVVWRFVGAPLVGGLVGWAVS